MDQRTVNGLADELQEALAQLDVPVRVDAARVRPDGLGELEAEVDARPVTMVVVARADLRPAAAKELPAFDPDDGRGAVGFVFADRLPEASREVLAARGWGWL